MKKITFILLFFIALQAQSQLISLVVRNDTVFGFNPSTGEYTQYTKLVPPMAGQSGKVLSNNGAVYQWVDAAAGIPTDSSVSISNRIIAKLSPDGNGSALTGLTATQVGLGNVTNESKATMFTSPTFTGTPVVPGYLVNTTTSGVGATATSSSTTTITHGLGRVPTTIRIKSISSFTSNAAATPVPFSEGTYNSSGNRCLYMVINGTTTQVSQTSTVFSIIMVTSAGNRIEGVIGNVGATTFDIVWTETGTHTAGNYLWEAQ